MDDWTIRLFLIPALLLALSQAVRAETESYLEEPPVIDPNILRQGLHEADIDDENFEVGLGIGFISVEDFGTQDYYFLRGAWHITEDLFFEAQYGMTTVDTSSAEDVSSDLILFTDSDREFTYYNLSVGFNLLPGEVFFGSNRVYNSDFYVLAGGGTLEFLGEKEFALNLGAGLRLIITDSLAIHVMFQDIVTDRSSTLHPNDDSGSAHHMNYSTSLTYFF